MSETTSTSEPGDFWPPVRQATIGPRIQPGVPDFPLPSGPLSHQGQSFPIPDFFRDVRNVTKFPLMIPEIAGGSRTGYEVAGVTP